eukprot:7117233-Alexandrium_andersonii.AAC.1
MQLGYEAYFFLVGSMRSTPTPAGEQPDSKPKQGAAVTEQHEQHVCTLEELHMCPSARDVDAFTLFQAVTEQHHS